MNDMAFREDFETKGWNGYPLCFLLYRKRSSGVSFAHACQSLGQSSNFIARAQ
jgi:hypothetical protein